MFFEISENRISRFISILSLMVLGTIGFLTFDGRFDLMQKTSIAYQNIKSTFSYIPHQMATAGSFIVNNDKAKSLPILLYHGIPKSTDPESLEVDFSTAFLDFVEQMQALKRDGWQTITLEEFRGFVRGERDLPDKSFLLTFDDGIKNSFYNVDPILRDLGWTAVMFAPTAYSLENNVENSTYYLSRQEMLHMLETGRWEIQSHGSRAGEWVSVDSDGTLGHFLSNKIWLESEDRLEDDAEFTRRIRADLESSKRIIEGRLGIRVHSFAYPFGDSGQETKNFDQSSDIIHGIVSSTYEMSFYQSWFGIEESFNYPSYSSDLFIARRIEPASDWNSQKLLAELEYGRAKSLPYRVKIFGNEWSGSWGEVERGNGLAVRALGNTTGAEAFLNGSHAWEDYYFRVRANWSMGTHVSLIARVQDRHNHYSCTFSSDGVVLREKVGGELATIESLNVAIGDPPDIELGIRVIGEVVECLVNNTVFIRSDLLEGGFAFGGVGVQVWQEEEGEASVIIYETNIQ